MQRDAGTVRPTVPKPAWETTVAAVPSAPLSTEGRMAIGAPSASATVSGVPRPEPRIVSIDRTVPPGAPTGNGATGNSAPRPGAVAALTLPDAAGGPSTGEMADTEKGVLDPGAAAVRAAKPSRDDEIYRRQRQAARRPPPPEPFKFPTYLGATGPKYFASQAYTERGSFSSRFYEKSKRAGETR